MLQTTVPQPHESRRSVHLGQLQRDHRRQDLHDPPPPARAHTHIHACALHTAQASRASALFCPPPPTPHSTPVPSPSQTLTLAHLHVTHAVHQVHTTYLQQWSPIICIICRHACMQQRIPTLQCCRHSSCWFPPSTYSGGQKLVARRSATLPHQHHCWWCVHPGGIRVPPSVRFIVCARVRGGACVCRERGERGCMRACMCDMAASLSLIPACAATSAYTCYCRCC